MCPALRLRTFAIVLLILVTACSPAATATPAEPPSPTAMPATAISGPTLAPAPTQPAATIVATDHAPLNIPAEALVITNGMVIVADGSDPISDGVVVIKQDRIIAVGHSNDFAIPQGVRVVDAHGGTIMPGIINAHVHGLAHPALRHVYFLDKGVTAICDMAARLSEMSTFKQDDRTQLAARGFRAGPIISAPGGYPGVYWGSAIGYEVANPAAAKAAVDDLADRDADVIKMAIEPGGPAQPWPSLTLEDASAIVQEAHARGLLVRAHVGRTEGTTVMKIIEESGLDVIDHVPIPVFSAIDAYNLIKDKAHYRIDVDYEARLKSLVDHGITMVPTLDAHTLWCESPRLTTQQKQACLDFYLQPVNRFHVLGGTVALGNDYGADSAIANGMPLREMKLLLAAGLTPLEVIEAGTRNSAYVCGHGDELGTLRVGKLADVIVVDGNPLNDIEAMQHLIAVVINGQTAYEAK